MRYGQQIIRQRRRKLRNEKIAKFICSAFCVVVVVGLGGICVGGFLIQLSNQLGIKGY